MITGISFDIVLRWVPGRGWIGIVIQDKKELFRSWSFEMNKEKALTIAGNWIKGQE